MTSARDGPCPRIYPTIAAPLALARELRRSAGARRRRDKTQAREELLRPRRPRCHRVATLLALTLFTLSAPSLLPCAAGAAEREAWGEGPIPPLSRQGRWLTDARGRVVLLHAFSDVAKTAPFYPAAFRFGEADAAFLEREGFNALRLGVEFQGLMPTPGQVDERYIDALAGTVELLGRHRTIVLLDFHQDGFSPYFLGGNGSSRASDRAVHPCAPVSAGLSGHRERCPDRLQAVYAAPSPAESAARGTGVDRGGA